MEKEYKWKMVFNFWISLSQSEHPQEEKSNPQVKEIALFIINKKFNTV